MKFRLLCLWSHLYRKSNTHYRLSILLDQFSMRLNKLLIEDGTAAGLYVIREHIYACRHHVMELHVWVLLGIRHDL